jgi:hypothetical protein
MLKYQWFYEMMHEWKFLNWFKASESVMQLGFNYAKKDDKISCWLVYHKNDKITCWLVCCIWRKHDLQRIGV